MIIEDNLLKELALKMLEEKIEQKKFIFKQEEILEKV